MKYDVGIIGSGPAGLSAAIYAKRANLSAVVIEKEYEGTGQIAESGQVDNYPGFRASAVMIWVRLPGTCSEAWGILHGTGSNRDKERSFIRF